MSSVSLFHSLAAEQRVGQLLGSPERAISAGWIPIACELQGGTVVPDFRAINRRKAGKWVLQLLEGGLLVVANSDDADGVTFSFIDGRQPDDWEGWHEVGKLAFTSREAWVEIDGQKAYFGDFSQRELRTKEVIPWIKEKLKLGYSSSTRFIDTPRRLLERARSREEQYQDAWRAMGLVLSRRPNARPHSPHPALRRIDGVSIGLDGTVVPPILATETDRAVLSELEDVSSGRVLSAVPVVAHVDGGARLFGFDPDYPRIWCRLDGRLLEHELPTGNRQDHGEIAEEDRGAIWGRGDTVHLILSTGEVRSLRHDTRAHAELGTIVQHATPLRSGYLMVSATPDALAFADNHTVWVCRGAPAPAGQPYPVDAEFGRRGNSKLSVGPGGRWWGLISAGFDHQFAQDEEDWVVTANEPDGHPEDVAIAPEVGLAVIMSRVAQVVDLETRSHFASWAIGTKHKLRGDFSPDGRHLLLLASDHLIALRLGAGIGFNLGYFAAGDDAQVQFSPCGRWLAVQGESLVVLDWSSIKDSLGTRPLVPFDVHDPAGLEQ